MARPNRRSVALLALLLAAALPGRTAESETAAAPAAAAERALDESGASKKLLELQAREAALRLLERDVERKLEELRALRSEALATIEPAEKSRQEDLAKLVSFYQAMKPQNAASLLEKLPRDLASDVLGSMKPRDAGKILNSMSSEQAVKISKRMAGQH